MENLFSNDVNRRIFIKGLGFVSLSLVFSTMGGCEELAEAIRNRPTRRRLRTGSPEVDADIDTYRQAVTLMKGLPAGDQRSWNNQAAIHGTVAGGFNFCQHGTPHFFDWHRAYLFYFEKICQKLTGNAKATGTFSAGNGHTLTLIVQGGGNSCTSANDFGYWTLAGTQGELFAVWRFGPSALSKRKGGGPSTIRRLDLAKFGYGQYQRLPITTQPRCDHR